MCEAAPTPQHNPDVLLCLANLSSDEVFTPPAVANAMLDLLPESIWSDPTATFLDPCSKSGVFLREAAKRLIRGLEGQIPDLQARLDHIFRRQLFALAITELTGLLSRRSVYCSRLANSKYALTRFETAEGNIRFPACAHRWNAQGRCSDCGAARRTFAQRAEQHAYALIHGLNPQELFTMQFDVILGNPPYQLDDGGNNASASPIYHLFVAAAKRLNPRYLTFVIPARWYTGGKGLDDFRQEMLADRRIVTLVDFPDSRDCFPGVDVAGGVCYFLWDRDHPSPRCEVTNIQGNYRKTLVRSLTETTPFVRANEALSIIHKVRALHEEPFSACVSSRKPFGLDTKRQPVQGPGDITLRWRGGVGPFLSALVSANRAWIPKWKVLISYLTADHAGQVDKEGKRRILAIIDLLPPGQVCTETYLVAGVFETEQEARNCIAYLKTQFVRFLIAQLATTQHISKASFHFVPQQDFSVAWTDAALNEKYGLTADEAAFIERLVKPMEA